MLFITLAVFITALPMKETYKPIILKQRAKKLGLPAPAGAEGASIKRALTLKLVRPLHMLSTEVSPHIRFNDFALIPPSQQYSSSPSTPPSPSQSSSSSSQLFPSSSAAPLIPSQHLNPDSHSSQSGSASSSAV
jgi:hypothetical protein